MKLLEICNGDDIISSTGKIGRVIEQYNSSHIVIELYELVDEEYDEFEALNIVNYPMSKLMKLKEVMRTNKRYSILVHEVIGFAFVSNTILG